MNYTKMNYTKKLNDLNDGFFLNIDEIVALIPNYKTYPTIKSYTEQYGKSLEDFKEIQSDFFMLKNEIENDITTLNKNIDDKNNQINKLDLIIKPLHDKLDSLMNSNNAGEGLLTDTELLHNQKYIGNWILLATIIGVCYMNKSIIQTTLA